jgi:hypothetical protein
VWKSAFTDLTRGRELGKIHTVIVSTKALESGARADLTLEGNQGDEESSAFEISGVDKTRHIFRTINLPAVEDIRIIIDYENGSSTKNCSIRMIICLGNFAER